MTPALLGKKIGMTRIYDDKGAIVPVTVVQAGPCAVTQVKTVETDGYHAVQLGFNDVKTIEVKDVVTSLAEGRPFYPDFREAYRVQRVVDAMLLSGRERRWVRVEEAG